MNANMSRLHQVVKINVHYTFKLSLAVDRLNLGFNFNFNFKSLSHKADN